MRVYDILTQGEHKSTEIRRFVPLGLVFREDRVPRVPLALHPGLPTLRPQGGLKRPTS